MILEMSTPLLQAVSNKLVKAVSTKDLIPSLKNFLFDVTEKNIHIIAGDASTYLEKDIPCNGISEVGKVSVDGKDFTKLINKINSDNVILETTEDNRLRIKAGKSKFHLKTINADDYVYPENLIPDVSGKKILLAELKKALKLGAITVSRNATEVYFTGYKIGQAVVTTNRNNLTIYSMPICDDNLLLTQDLVNLLYDLDGDTAEIGYTLDFIEIKTEGTRILGNLLSGLELFPQDDILEAFQFDKVANVSKKELLPVLDRAMIFVDAIGALEMDFQENIIRCSLLGTTEANTYEEINYVGNLQVKLNVNVGMLKEICSALETDIVTFKISEPESPLLVTSGQYQCLMATMTVE